MPRHIYSTDLPRSHNTWRTRAPKSSILPFEDGGNATCSGSFACTRGQVSAGRLHRGAKVKGISVISWAPAIRRCACCTYEKDGRTTSYEPEPLHHKQKPFGPSPF